MNLTLAFELQILKVLKGFIVFIAQKYGNKRI